jgi:ribosome-associated protein
VNIIDKIGLKTELNFRTSRSSGPGGQSVNKVATKVELLFDLWSSQFLLLEQKEIIADKLKNRISNEGILSLASDETRSQLNNKDLVVERFFKLLEDALKLVKKRRPTRPSRSSKEKRLKTKKIKSDKKDLRKPPEM